MDATCMSGNSLMVSPSYLLMCRLRAETATAYLPRHASDDHYQSLEYPCECDCKHCLPLSADLVSLIMADNSGPLSTTSKHQALTLFISLFASIHALWLKMHCPEMTVVQMRAILQLAHDRLDREEVPRKHSKY